MKVKRIIEGKRQCEPIPIGACVSLHALLMKLFWLLYARLFKNTRHVRDRISPPILYRFNQRRRKYSAWDNEKNVSLALVTILIWIALRPRWRQFGEEISDSEDSLDVLFLVIKPSAAFSRVLIFNFKLLVHQKGPLKSIEREHPTKGLLSWLHHHLRSPKDIQRERKFLPKKPRSFQSCDRTDIFEVFISSSALVHLIILLSFLMLRFLFFIVCLTPFYFGTWT